MDKNWVATSEWGDWTAIARFVENPTRRDTIEAASEMSEYAGWGQPDGDGPEFRDLVRCMEPVMVTHHTGQEALDVSNGEYEEYWEEDENGTIMAWVVR